MGKSVLDIVWRKLFPSPQPTPQHLFSGSIFAASARVSTHVQAHTHSHVISEAAAFFREKAGWLVGWKSVFVLSPPPLMTSDALLLQTTQKPQGRGSKVGKGVETESNQGKNSEKGTPSRSNKFPKRVTPFGSGNLASWNLIRSSAKKQGKLFLARSKVFFPFVFQSDERYECLCDPKKAFATCFLCCCNRIASKSIFGT